MDLMESLVRGLGRVVSVTEGWDSGDELAVRERVTIYLISRGAGLLCTEANCVRKS